MLGLAGDLLLTARSLSGSAGARFQPPLWGTCRRLRACLRRTPRCRCVGLARTSTNDIGRWRGVGNLRRDDRC